MNKDEIKKLDKESLLKEVKQLKEELFKLKMNLAAGQTKDSSQFKKVRVNIAQCLTVLNVKKQ